MPDESYDYDSRANGTSDDYHDDNTPEYIGRHRKTGDNANAA